MLGSILSRFTGIGLYVGLILVGVWLAALAAGPATYEIFHTYAAHPLALVVWIGLTLCAFYHLAAGVRHLIWDMGVGLKPATADLLSTLSIWFALLATVAFWGWLFLDGRVQL
jgi:succinate dehydrogenase / fumarate reductase cytochrome b subunit